MQDLRRHTEKSGFVIDFGQFYTKIGVQGEAAPAFVIPTNPDQFLKKLDQDRKNVNVIYSNSIVDDEELERNLSIFFEDIFLNKFSMLPTNRLIFIVCSMMVPKRFQYALQKVLLYKFKLNSVFFVNNLLCPLYLTGNYSGIVVETGFTDCMVLPVYDGSPIISAFKFSTIGGFSIFRDLLHYLKKDNPESDFELLPTVNNPHVFKLLNSVLIRFGSILSRRQEMAILESDKLSEYKAKLKASVFTFKDHNTQRTWKLSKWSAMRACKSLFNDDKYKSVARVLQESIYNITFDIRVLILENIILSGGVTLIPGFVHRLKEEIAYLLQTEKNFKDMAEVVNQKLAFNSIDYPPNLMGWAGGKLYNTLIVEETKHSINIDKLEKEPEEVEKIYQQFYIL